ncbi:MAG TPA: Fur family transcriptional regulator [Microthrixaceae bacterium]|nr:Fur family transcriptional regulator [Microthrixaceae bacterium]
MSTDGSSLDEIHKTAAQRLKSDGLRYTSSRRSVVDILASSDGPLTIPEILTFDDELAQSSAYRNLNELITCGVVHRVISGEDHSHFELTEDFTSHHHHLICTKCGRVDDVTLADSIEVTLTAALEKVAGANGFSAEHHRLDVLGLCVDCS